MPIPTPWMAYYPDRFTKQTDQLRPIEHSAYYRLFESYAQTGHLLNDPYMLRNIVKLDSELTVIQGLTGTKPDYGTWVEFTDSIVNSLLAQFFTLESGGTYHHAGWDKEVVKARASYDGRVKGAMAANAKRDAERSAEQHTTNNVQRTTIQPATDSFTSDNAQPTTDNSQSTSPNASEQTTATTAQRSTDNPQRKSETRNVTAAIGGSYGISHPIAPVGASGQSAREQSATGPLRWTGQTAATSAARPQRGQPLAQGLGT